MRKEAERQGATGEIRGVFYEGQVHIVASQIRSEAEIEENFLHEGGGHYGARRLFGKRVKLAMANLYWKTDGLKGIRALTEKHGLADKMAPYFEAAKNRRVEGRRGSPPGHPLACFQGFPLRARGEMSAATFPAPATPHAACGLPAQRAPAHCASRLMGPTKLERLSAVDTRLGSHGGRPAFHISTADSTASNRSPGADGHTPGGAESCAQPTGT